MQELIVTRDGRSTPIYGRVISDSTSGKNAIGTTVYSATVPVGSQIIICTSSLPFLISDQSFTFPSTQEDAIPNGILLNPGAIYCENITTLYYATIEDAFINLEFYKV